MNGLHTLDLAATLDAARRDDMRAAAVHARSSPPGKLRAAAGAWLVRTGNRLLESPRDLAPSSTGSTGS